MEEKAARKPDEQRPIQKVKTESREDYLKSIYVFSHMCDGSIRSSELAEYMGLSKASVCRMVGIMKNEGLLIMNDDFSLCLTAKGEAEAAGVHEKYRFFEQLLLEAGVESRLACEEACRMEHMLSDESFRKLERYWNVTISTPIDPKP